MGHVAFGPITSVLLSLHQRDGARAASRDVIKEGVPGLASPARSWPAVLSNGICAGRPRDGLLAPRCHRPGCRASKQRRGCPRPARPVGPAAGRNRPTTHALAARRDWPVPCLGPVRRMCDLRRVNGLSRSAVATGWTCSMSGGTGEVAPQLTRGMRRHDLSITGLLCLGSDHAFAGDAQPSSGVARYRFRGQHPRFEHRSFRPGVGRVGHPHGHRRRQRDGNGVRDRDLRPDDSHASGRMHAIEPVPRRLQRKRGRALVCRIHNAARSDDAASRGRDHVERNTGELARGRPQDQRSGCGRRQ